MLILACDETNGGFEKSGGICENEQRQGMRWKMQGQRLEVEPGAWAWRGEEKERVWRTASGLS